MVAKQPKFKPSFKSVKTHYGDDARAMLLSGIERISKTAGLTLGPGGRNVAIEYEAGDPKITKDGVTVVKSIFENTRAKDLGAKIIKRAAGNTNTYAGDGTTTVTLLAHEITKAGFNAVEFAGAHPIGVKTGLIKAREEVIEFLEEMILPVVT